jgi:TRAP-type C4-dicarboxylate transport system substrate-binding protein
MKVAFAILGAFVTLSCASAEETTLKFGIASPPTIHVNSQVLLPWAQRVNERGAGVVKVEVYAGTGVVQMNNTYDRTLNEVVQIASSLHSNIPGKFPRSDVITLPFLTESAEIASIAGWRLYKTGLLDPEYDQVIALYISGFAPSTIHLGSQPRSNDDLRGLKVIAGGKVLADAVTRLSGAPVTFNLSETYTALQRHTADGIAMQWTAFSPFKLAEVTRYHIEAALGSASGMVFMTKARYQALPANVRTVIEAESGEPQSRVYGKFWDRIQNEERDRVKVDKAHTIVSLTPQQAESWRKRLAPVEEAWANETPDGQKVLEAFRRLVAEASRN